MVTATDPLSRGPRLAEPPVLIELWNALNFAVPGTTDTAPVTPSNACALYVNRGFGAGMIAASVVDGITAREAATAPSASAGGAAQVPLPGFVISRKGAAFGLRLAF